VPLSSLSVYKISRQLDNAFVVYKKLSHLDETKKEEKINEETKPISKVYISETPSLI